MIRACFARLGEKMKFSLKINNQPYEVEANPLDDGSFAVVLNNREFKTQISKSDAKDFEVIVQDTLHKISLDGALSADSFKATANGKQVSVELSRADRAAVSKRSSRFWRSGRTRISEYRRC